MSITQIIKKSQKKNKTVNKEISVIIPTATPGNRMKYLGVKSLIELPSGKTILQTQIETIREVLPKADIILIGGFEINKIRKIIRQESFGIRLIYNSDYETTGVFYSISLGIQASIAKNFLIMYGDIILNSETMAKICRNSSSALVYKDKSLAKNTIGAMVNNKTVISFCYDAHYKWFQTAYLCGREAECIRKMSFTDDTDKWFCHEALNRIIQNNCSISAVQPEGLAVEIDSAKDLEKLKI